MLCLGIPSYAPRTHRLLMVLEVNKSGKYEAASIR